jgi:hypothetical protein
MNRAGLRLVAAVPSEAPVVVCLSCRIDFDECRHGGEAAHFAATHNDLHHGSSPVAFVVGPSDSADVEAEGPFGGDAA